MEKKIVRSYVLCPDCTECPTVDIYEEAVHIGEEGNQVWLKKEEWNRLVEAIQEGKLEAVQCDCGCGCQ
ncbi:MAG: hypothetical protein HYU86_11200 [Chloroflexi bacterium]|nr:hypothetical protein [Chloroflexota bacterium]